MAIAFCLTCLKNKLPSATVVSAKNSASTVGWLAVHVEEYLYLFDDLRYSFVSDNGSGPEINDMVFFLCACPALCRKMKTLTVFRLYCLCLYNFPNSMPDVRSVQLFRPAKVLICARL